MKKYLLLPFLVCMGLYANAQVVAVKSNSTTANNNWAVSYQPSKVFIENKGQFPKVNNLSVEYVIDNDRTKIYFSSIGITYSFFKEISKDKEETERKRENSEHFKTTKEWLAKEKEERSASIKKDYVNLIWENANQNTKIVAEEQVEEYFSYSFKEKTEVSNINYIKGFKKITYKNLYPNIDVEYTFHPIEGIKYALILHPDADISVVKMKYTDAAKINIIGNGDLHIGTAFGDIIDHAPVTFYANNNSSLISSKFIKDGNSISFELKNYDKTQTIVVDPWTQTPTISNSNGVWECEKDGAGNVYIIGGDMPMKLIKYNSAGVIQWTFVTPYDTANAWLGTFATDLNGNSYVTCGSTAALTKVNTSGGQVYSVTGGNMDEYWSMAFNCDQTKLVVGGTRLNAFPTIKGYGAIFDINTSNGSITNTVTVGYTCPSLFGTVNPDEVRSISASYNDRYYYLTLDSIGAIDQSFSSCSSNPSLFKINSGFNFGYKCENYRPPNGNSGIMAIKANKNFVYTHRGDTISKRSLATGNIISKVAISGGLAVTSFSVHQVGNSGIDIDSCGNVYVGSVNAVIKYDANLNQLSSVAVPFAVYDVAVSYGGNIIVNGATGTSITTIRTGYVQSVPMSACNPMTLTCCNANVCPVGPFCTTSSAYTLSPGTTGGTWSGTGVNASGVFNPATAGIGIHTIIYSLGCGIDSIQIKVDSISIVTTTQNGNVITANQTGGTYQWLNCNNGKSVILGATNQSYTATIDGNYAVVITKNGCTDTSACVNISGTEIKNISLVNNVTIYPNPSNGTFAITTNELVNAIVVIDVLGNEVLTINPSTTTTNINLNQQPNGIYFVKIISTKTQLIKRVLVNK